TIPSSQSTMLFRRLAAKSAGSYQSSNLRSMLGVLADDQDGSSLGEVLEVIAPAVRALPIRQRSPLLKSLALAYTKAGQVARARLEASNLDALAPQLSLVAYNPFVSAEHKLGTVRFEVELEARTGRKGAQWTRTWLNRLARWVTRLASEK